MKKPANERLNRIVSLAGHSRLALMFAKGKYGMKLWPYDSFEIETSLTIEAVVHRLAAVTEPAKWFSLPFGKHRAFQGAVSREGFKVTRFIRYRNSFLPIVHGTFRQGPSGTTVLLRMRLHLFVAVFICLWSILMLGSLGFFQVFKSGPELHPIDFIPVAFLAFPWAIGNLPFWFEANKKKKMLIDVLK